ncbi:MAG: MFS transporter [Patescibacteria group bacterium]|nr:MFS transporter [Patescibacteria group bacterium]
MINIFLNLIKESEGATKKIVLIVRTSTLFGYLGVTLFFQFYVTDIFSLKLWNHFFTFGWIFSLILITAVLVISRKTRLRFNVTEDIQEKKARIREETKKYKIFNPLMIYIAYFLTSSDYLFLFLFTSWIFNRFGEMSWRTYISLALVFVIAEFLGNLLAYELCDKFRKRKIMLIAIFSYMFMMVLLIFSNFLVLMVLSFFLAFVGTICNFTYTSFVADLSKNKKNKTFKYQLLHTYNSLARILFVPLGFYLYSFIKIENLIMISCLLFGISGLFIFLTYFTGNIYKLKLKVKKGKNFKYQMIIWLKKNTELEKELEMIFEFFKENILIMNTMKFCRYYKITSKNPAIMLSLCSSVNELIPDAYFKSEETP